MSYTIKEVSEMFHIPTTTLRYYEKEGLLPSVERKASGYRVFSDDDLAMLRVIECLKKANMSLREIRTYTQLAQLGDATLKERYHMILTRRKVVQEQMADLQRAFDFIVYKCTYYETAITALERGSQNKNESTAKPDNKAAKKAKDKPNDRVNDKADNKTKDKMKEKGKSKSGKKAKGSKKKAASK